MIEISPDASDEQVLQIVQAWVDLFAALGPEDAFAAIATEEVHDPWSPYWLQRAVTNYRPLELYPGVQEFVVTPCGSARAVGHEPTRRVLWCDPAFMQSTGLAGKVEFGLPLNGQWSDLLVEFDIWTGDAPDEDYLLALDEIRCWEQHWAEQVRADAAESAAATPPAA